jgi:transposase
MPLRKIKELSQDLWSFSINENTILNFSKQAYEGLATFEKSVRTALQQSAVIHADETGTKAGGHLRWAHVNSTEKLSLIHIESKRGLEGILSDQSALKGYQGTIAHDCLKSYFDIPAVNHACCGSHLLRELRAQLEENKKWAHKMKNLLMYLYRSPTRKNKNYKHSILIRYGKIIQAGKKEEPIPKPAERKKSKGLNLLHRFESLRDYILGFAFNANTPFTNNQAERDIRNLKVKQKIAGCFRSDMGAKWYTRIISFISTLRKNSYNIYEYLINLFSGYAFSIRT